MAWFDKVRKMLPAAKKQAPTPAPARAALPAVSSDPESRWPKWAREAAEEGRKVYHSAYEPQRRSNARSWAFPHGQRGWWIR